jgi:hypothetical protein
MYSYPFVVYHGRTPGKGIIVEPTVEATSLSSGDIE